MANRKSDSQTITSNLENGEKRCLVKTEESISMYSGPLPHPEMLREYAMIVKDAPERIFKMAESQNKHRIEIEKTYITGNMKLEQLGVLFGLIIPVAGMICGTIIAISGYGLWGFSSIIATLLPSSGSYIYGKIKNSKKKNGEGTNEKSKENSKVVNTNE